MAASHVVFSEQGLIEFSGIADVHTALLEVATDISGWVCVTCGERGVLWVADGEILKSPSFRVTVKDTLGAGDIWHGAFALMLAEGQSEEHAVRVASAAAALKCEGTGREAAPTREELNQFLKDRT
jgi:sulfofructose kinase